jgi:uncharacterized protein (DUF1697 family)
MTGASEGAHMGHPDFRANGRIFATLSADERQGVVMLAPADQQAFLAAHPGVFAPASGAWGRQGCTTVKLAAVDLEVLGEAMTLAWRNRAERAGRSGSSPRAGQTGQAGRAGGAGRVDVNCVGLLRAINLAGKNAVSMADLRAMLEGLGFANGQSLLQSGNLVFRAKGARPSIEKRLEAECLKRLKVATSFFVRTAPEWAGIIGRNPFPDEAARDPGHLLLLLLKSAATPAAVRSLQAAIVGREVVRASGDEAYIVYPDGVGRSKLTTALIERHLQTRVTARNWNTALKIARLLGV